MGGWDKAAVLREGTADWVEGLSSPVNPEDWGHTLPVSFWAKEALYQVTGTCLWSCDTRDTRICAEVLSPEVQT